MARVMWNTSFNQDVFLASEDKVEQACLQTISRLFTKLLTELIKDATLKRNGQKNRLIYPRKFSNNDLSGESVLM